MNAKKTQKWRNDRNKSKVFRKERQRQERAEGGRESGGRERRKETERYTEMEAEGPEAERVGESCRASQGTNGRRNRKRQRQTSRGRLPLAWTQLRSQKIGNASENELKSIPPGLHQPTCQVSVLRMTEVSGRVKKGAGFKSLPGHFLDVALGKSMTLSEPWVQNADKKITWQTGWAKFQARQGL